MAWIIEIVKQSLMISTFVLIMMLIIEFLNVQTRGAWSKGLKKSSFLQVLVAAFLGFIPGCLGAYAVVSLFTHNILSFGALTAAMIATSGDEAFIMLGLIPADALKIMAIIFLVGIVTGLLVDVFFKKKFVPRFDHYQFPIHNEPECCYYSPRKVLPQLKNISFTRAVLLFFLILMLLGFATGTFQHSHDFTQGHEHEVHNHGVEKGHWMPITFMILAGIALFIVTISTEHFLEKHLWQHIIKKHLPKIFLWTLGALLLIHFLKEYISIEEWIKDNYFVVLVIALLIGIIPESGPHMIFVSLFIAGAVPLSILLASSVVQDGHGALPLLAESKRGFLLVKGVNIVVGFVVGLVGYFMI